MIGALVLWLYFSMGIMNVGILNVGISNISRCWAQAVNLWSWKEVQSNQFQTPSSSLSEPDWVDTFAVFKVVIDGFWGDWRQVTALISAEFLSIVPTFLHIRFPPKVAIAFHLHPVYWTGAHTLCVITPFSTTCQGHSKPSSHFNNKHTVKKKIIIHHKY